MTYVYVFVESDTCTINVRRITCQACDTGMVKFETPQKPAPWSIQTAMGGNLLGALFSFFRRNHYIRQCRSPNSKVLLSATLRLGGSRLCLTAIFHSDVL